MTQENIFGPPPPTQQAGKRLQPWEMPYGYGYRTHKGDPVTSLEAEKMMAESGRIAAQAKSVLEAWTKYGPGTARQISQRSGLDYHLISRRRNEIEDHLQKTGEKIGRAFAYMVVE